MEFPIFEKSWNKNLNELEIVYPNLYYGGVYNLGQLIIYNLVNKRDDFICYRKFLDQSDLKSNLIGFTFQYEPDYYNFFKILEKNNISLDKNRKQVIFAGGPCVNMNVKALEKYIDFFVIGSVEGILEEILDNYCEDKKEFLKKISKIKGVYVPGLNEISEADVNLDEVDYALVQPLPEKIDKNFVFGKCFILEVERGCPFHCKFCPLGNLYKISYRSLEKIKKIIDDGVKINKRDKIVIYSASFTHPKRKEILKYMLNKDLKFSVPSIKVDIADKELLDLIKKGGQKTVSIAPECNESLRFEIGKKVSDEKYFDFIKMCNNVNIETVKMYFMIGLPEQNEKDLDEMMEFIERCKELFKGEIYVSVNYFIPKPKSAFEDFKFDKKRNKELAKYLELKGRYKLVNLSNAYLQWKLGFEPEMSI